MTQARRGADYIARLGGFCLAAALLSGSEPGHAQVRIHDIQGRGHESPLAGQMVEKVPGIVTALRPHGFYMQDALPDDDPFTSEGVFVYAAAAPGVAPGVKVGDAVAVSGTVVEFRPQTAASGSFGSTNIRLSALETSAREMSLPEPVVLSGLVRSTPDPHMADFNPAVYFPAFYESLEGMRVRVPEARVVGPAASGAVMVVPEGVFPGTRFSSRGALPIAEGNFNLQRLMLYAPSVLPQAKVGDRLNESKGILDHGGASYALWLDAAPAWRAETLEPESARIAAPDELSIAVYNVENLGGRDSPQKFERLAAQIARNLRNPDIVGLLEVQDDSGARDDGVTNASRTMEKLIVAIRELGGPAYVWSAVDPVNNADGGQPGGNIRQVLLFNPQRVSLKGPPIRIGTEDGAFMHSRKPLVAAFEYRGRPLTVLLNHFVSKRGDGFCCGMEIGSQASSEPQRIKQARIVAEYVRGLLASDAQARVVAMGDLNDFEFSRALHTLEEAGLSNPALSLPPQERYSYIHEGNAQMLDHILLSRALAVQYDCDIVHMNAEFPAAMRASDHDAVLLRLR